METPPVVSIAEPVRRMRDLALGGPFLDQPARRAEAVAIGEALHAAHGFNAMLPAYDLIDAHWAAGHLGAKTPDAFHPSEFNHAWEGIGEWRS